MSDIALVVGGTGLVGGHLVDFLVKSHAYEEIIVLVRPGSSYHKEGTKRIEVDFDHLMDFDQFLKAEAVFCCLGTTIKKAGSKENFRRVDFDYPLAIAQKTKQLGAQQFNIITAGGANSKSLFFYSRVKGDIEKAIAELNFHNLNIFRPSLLLGKREEKRITEDIGAAVARIINPTLLGKMRKYRAIQAQIVANAMVEVSLKNLSGIHIIESDEIQKIGKI